MAILRLRTSKKKLLYFVFIITVITFCLFYKQKCFDDLLTYSKLESRTSFVEVAAKNLNAILSRKYITELEQIRRNLLRRNITANSVPRNLTAVDTNNHDNFKSVMKDQRNILHSIWFSENITTLAPFLAKNYYSSAIRECNNYKRKHPKSICYASPKDVEKPQPFSTAAKHDLIVTRFSERSATQNQLNFTYIIVVDGGFATPDGEVIKDNWKIMPSSCMFKRKITPSLYFQPPTNIRRYREVFVLAQYRGKTFFHFLVENLTRIAAYLSFLLKHPSIKILVVRKTDFTLAFLSGLGIEPSRLVSEDVQADIIYMPAGTPCGRASIFSGQFLSILLRAGMSEPEPPRDTIILIRRSEKRWFDHHDAILEMLRKHADSVGLKTVVYGDNPVLGFSDTRRLFSRAYIVVAPHGAGESNVIFSQPGTVLIEGLHPDSSGNIVLCYEYLMHQLGHRYCGLLLDKPCMNVTVADIEPFVKYYINKLKVK